MVLMRMQQTLPRRLENRELRLMQALKALHKQKKLWEPYENRYQTAWNKYTVLAKNLTVSQEQRLALATGHLDAVSPLKILSRGYSVTANGQGQIVKSVQDVHWGEEIRTRLSDGEVYSVIQQIDIDDKGAR
jgi:exodeoxyribonuclease VII large subunit